MKTLLREKESMSPYEWELYLPHRIEVCETMIRLVKARIEHCRNILDGIKVKEDEKEGIYLEFPDGSREYKNKVKNPAEREFFDEFEERQKELGELPIYLRKLENILAFFQR